MLAIEGCETLVHLTAALRLEQPQTRPSRRPVTSELLEGEIGADGANDV